MNDHVYVGSHDELVMQGSSPEKGCTVLRFRGRHGKGSGKQIVLSVCVHVYNNCLNVECSY